MATSETSARTGHTNARAVLCLLLVAAMLAFSCARFAAFARSWGASASAASMALAIVAAVVAGFAGVLGGIGAYDFLTPETPEGLRKHPWIQPNARPTSRKKWTGQTERRIIAVNIAIAAIAPVPAVLFWWTRTDMIWTAPTTGVEIARFVRDLVVSALSMDLFYYCYHFATHHGPRWLRRLHAVHHEVTAPRGKWASYYIHPVEQTIGTLLTTWGCLGVYFLFDHVSAYAIVVAVLPTAVMTVLEHGGRRIRPFGPIFDAAHHDDHHHYFLCNYAEYYPFWDWIFRTAGVPASVAAKVEVGSAAASHARTEAPVEDA